MPVLLADCSVFLSERDCVEYYSGLLYHFALLSGLVPTQNMRLYASWVEWSFATPSALPTAIVLISRFALLLYTH